MTSSRGTTRDVVVANDIHGISSMGRGTRGGSARPNFFPARHVGLPLRRVGLPLRRVDLPLGRVGPPARHVGLAVRRVGSSVQDQYGSSARFVTPTCAWTERRLRYNSDKMTSFPAYATGFQLHPTTGVASQHLSPLFSQLTRVEYLLRVPNVAVNQGQMLSDFDSRLESVLQTLGGAPHSFRPPPEIRQQFDFAFTFDGRSVAVEIEKSNREKILRDILKCHMYLHYGADLALLVLPRNYPHTSGVWNLFDEGVERFNDCQTYRVGTPESLGRIAILGFEQFDARTGERLSHLTRQRMRAQAQAEAARSTD
jgi:hypothetical protein